MDAVNSIRNFGANNRGLVVNTVYIVAVLVILYFLVQFYLSGVSLDKTLLANKIVAKPATTDDKSHVFTISSEASDVRIKDGGEYTLSFWMYIQNWSSIGGNIPVMYVHDESLTSKDSKNPEYVLACALYANEPKMMVRVGGVGDASASTTSFPGTPSTTSTNMPQCDVMDIDLQRWINITISVNGRIVDVYLDGKLSRSCILPTTPSGISAKGVQSVVLNGGFTGYFSGVQFSAYAVTPDQIYARYMAGPYSSKSFLDFITEKIGISLTYKYEASSSS
jgi:hypothetical protein